MEKVSLYIAGNKVDLDDNSFILFNYTMEDLNNPTIVKNSFSKQITLKGTPANNKIFGSLYKADRTTLFTSDLVGASFDTLRKTPFVIYNDLGEIIESGYVKVDSVSIENDMISYGVSLYGGLGSFFYGLSYNEDGNKKTLNDIFTLEEKVINKTTLQEAWSALSTSATSMWSIVNFAPAYNGIPDNFDANKAIVKGVFSQFSKDTKEGDAVYTEKQGCVSSLVKMENKHTEWEVRNIRPYLQRPVVKLKAIVDALKDSAINGGYTLSLDSRFFNATNAIYNNAWVTLSLISKEKRNSYDALQSVLKGSLTPADYLLGMAKMFGLVFLYDVSRKTISIQTRNGFYSSKTIVDISQRIDSSSIQIQPNIIESKWIQLGNEAIGEEAKSYQERQGLPYGCQRINTGYGFNSDINVLTESIPFKIAADVTEKNRYYTFSWDIENNKSIPAFPFSSYEQVTWERYKGSEKKDFSVPAPYYNDRTLVEGKKYQDWLPKLQLHEAENKATDGSHCVVIFDGIKDTAYDFTFSMYYSMWISDDHPDMETLNAGTPCWSFIEGDAVEIRSLPSFRRALGEYMVDWGVPRERFVEDVSYNAESLYDRYWKKYLSDRYDVDSRVMKCKVNLSGLQVGQKLLKTFFFYDNAIWVLNKIENHSITTHDLTDCEFVKVKDINNYSEGQDI